MGVSRPARGHAPKRKRTPVVLTGEGGSACGCRAGITSAGSHAPYHDSPCRSSHYQAQASGVLDPKLPAHLFPSPLPALLPPPLPGLT